MKYFVVVPAMLLVGGCVATVTPPRVEVAVPPPAVYVPPPPPPVVSVYVEPPIDEPPPIAVAWAPPPMLVEVPPPPPFPEAVWVGGYWVWHGNWVWAHGHWMAPPRPNYGWVHPYYENRDGVVIFIAGHWAAPGAVFVPPPPGLHLTVEVALPGVVAGPRPIGPNGCFVPPPPGSRPGFIVPAPVGTAPAVVTGAPPVVAVGMRISANTTINNRTTNVTNITNVTNVTNVTIVAPPGATAGGKAFNSQVPARANLAAAQPSTVKAFAPEPASTKPIPTYRPGTRPIALPAAQAVNTSAPPPHPAPAQNGRAAHAAGDQNGNAGLGGPGTRGGPGNKPAVAQNNGGAGAQSSPDSGADHGNRHNGMPERAPRADEKHDQGNHGGSGANVSNHKPAQAVANREGQKPRMDKTANGKKEKKEQKKEPESNSRRE